MFLKTGLSVTQSNFNDASVLIPSFISGFLAKTQNEKRAARIREAMAARRRQIKAGEAVPGSMPCWLACYQRKLIVVEEKANSVGKLFEMSLAGLGVESMIKELLLNNSMDRTADSVADSSLAGLRMPLVSNHDPQTADLDTHNADWLSTYVLGLPEQEFSVEVHARKLIGGP